MEGEWTAHTRVLVWIRYEMSTPVVIRLQHRLIGHAHACAHRLAIATRINGSRVAENDEPRAARGLPGFWMVAESVGFEPTDRFDTINALAGRPIRPLWQLSVGNAIRHGSQPQS